MDFTVGRWSGFAVGLAAVAFASQASAATFEVTGTGDPAPDRCKRTDCSLREAIRAANATANADEIVLEAKTYELAQLGDDDDALAGDLDVLQAGSNVVITGEGRAKTTIDGSDVDRVFELHEGRLALRDLGVENGRADVNGGAILNNGGALAITDSRFISNRAFQEGGAIYQNGDATLRVTDALFSGNVAFADGGGPAGGGVLHARDTSRSVLKRVTMRSNLAIEYGGAIFAQNDATVRILDSTLDENGNDGSLSYGGAILARNAARLVIGGTTLSRNKATDGAAIIGWDEAIFNIENSTFSGNSAQGGTIYAANVATFTISFTTFSDNSSASSAVIDNNTSGGSPSDRRFTFRGVVMAGNSAQANCTGTGGDSFQSNGANVEDMNTCAFNTGTDRVNANAGLFPLADNGGPTKTHALRKSSDAVGAAEFGSCPSRDQRGEVRPQGNACDGGSFERK